MVASAIAWFERFGNKEKKEQITVKVEAEGGALKVRFLYDAGTYKEVTLIGPAKKIFNGNVETGNQ